MRHSIRRTPYAIRAVAIFAALLVFLPNLTGCASLRDKFIRKKKPKTVGAHYYQIEKYNVVPNIELYQKHYVYWRSWHRELVEQMQDSYMDKDNIKKYKRCLTEMISNLDDMSSMLVDGKAEGLDKHIEALKKVKSQIDKGDFTSGTKTRIRRVLEKEFMLIKIDFTYRKMEPYLADKFRLKTLEKS